MNINESTERYIRKQIPFISKNIYEANLGGNPRLPGGSPGPLRGRIGTVVDNVLGGLGRVAAGGARALGRGIKRQFEVGKELQKQTARQVERDVYDHHMSKAVGVTVQEFRRLRDQVPEKKPLPPSQFIVNATGQSVLDPNYMAKLDRHNAAMEDWKRKQAQNMAIASVVNKDKSLGALHSQLYGRMVSFRPDPYNVATPGTPANITRFKIGGTL